MVVSLHLVFLIQRLRLYAGLLQITMTLSLLLDDFLTVDIPDVCAGERSMALLTLLFARLGVPLGKPQVHRALQLFGIPLDHLGNSEYGGKIANG